MRGWLTSLPAKIVEGVIGGVLVVLVVDHYHDHVRIHSRTWLFGTVVVVLLGLWTAIVLLINRGSSRATAASPEPTEVEALRQRVADVSSETDRWEAYAEHLGQILDHLQQRIAGAIPTVTYQDFIERGVLGPARDMLKRDPDGDVRLSILDSPDDKTWRMPLAAGHSLVSQQKYELAIDESLSRFAYRNGKPYVWHDVEKEASYTPHPEARRPFRSMISLPIRGGEKIWGVFNVVSTVPNAFEDVDIEYTKLIGSIINVATSLILAERTGDGDERRKIDSGSD